MVFGGSGYMQVLAKFFILGQFFNGQLVCEISLYVSVYGTLPPI